MAANCALKLLDSALPLLSSPSLSTLRSVQLVPSSPPTLLLRTGHWGEIQKEYTMEHLAEYLNSSSSKEAAKTMCPSQTMMVAAVCLGISDAKGSWTSSSLPEAASYLADTCTSHGVQGKDKASSTVWTHSPWTTRAGWWRSPMNAQPLAGREGEQSLCFSPAV